MDNYQATVGNTGTHPYTEQEAAQSLASAYAQTKREAWVLNGNGNGYIPDEPPPGVGVQDILQSWSVAEEPPWANAADTAATVHYSDPLQPSTATYSRTDEQLTQPKNVSDAGADLAGLLGELDAIGENDRQAVTLFALGNVENLAGMDKASLGVFCTHLRAKGVTAEWIRTDLRPAIAEAQKEAAQSGQPNSGGFAGEATWRHYVAAAQNLGYTFRLNDLSDTVETNGERMTDVHEAILLSKLHEMGLKTPDVARRAFTTAAAQNRYHPVKEYFAGLKWDGEDHIGKLAGYFTDTHDQIEYKDGTQRTVFSAFFRRWLVGAVGKVYDSRQCQNPMLVLAGDQGSGKSYFAKWICPFPELHFEGAIHPDDKDFNGYLTTKWIWEVSELGSTMRKADRESLKDFITKQDATYRPAYARHPLVKPALSSFIGTVNFDGALLDDSTGHRRFWPVDVAIIDWKYSQDVDKSQVWAQACALYKAGEPWALSTEERAAHRAIVEVFEVEDIVAGYILEYFTVRPGDESLFLFTTDILSTLRKPDGADLTGSDDRLTKQVAKALTSLGLKRGRKRKAEDDGRTQAQSRCWYGIGRKGL